MNLSGSQTVRRLVLLLIAAWTCPAIGQSGLPYINRNLVVLDPAHGGQDKGADLNGEPEKDVTLDLATDLRAALTARGFTVVSTREADLPASAPLLTNEQRAGTANHLRPAACLVIHATMQGNGVHLFTSALAAPVTAYDPSTPIPWEDAQSIYLLQSQRLVNSAGLALVHAKMPVLISRANLRPLDNMTCPAIALEVAPLTQEGKKTAVTDSGYIQHVADLLAGAIQSWRDAELPRPAPAGGVTP